MKQKTNSEIIERSLDAGVSAQNKDEIETALKHYHRVLEINPDHAVVNHNIGIIEVGRGNLSEALQRFSKAINANANNIQYQVSLIGTYLKLGNVQEAKMLFLKAQSLGIRSDGLCRLEAIFRKLDNDTNLEFEAKFLQIAKLYESDQLADAKRLANELLTDYPNEPSLLNLCGLCTSKSGEFNHGYKFYTRAIELRSDFAEAYNNRGLLLLEHQKYEHALADFKQALTLKPNYSKANNNIGLVHFNLGNYQQAISHFQAAVLTQPEYVIALINLANCYKANGQVQVARETYQLAIYKDNNIPEAHINFSELLNSSGEIDLAISHLNQAIEINPYIASAHFNLGNIHRKIGHYSTAISSYQNAISLDKTHFGALNNLGLTFKDRGELDAALEALQKAIILEPNYAEAYNNLANVYKLLGNNDAAFVNYEKAINLNPKYDDALLNIFEILEKTNRLEQLAQWISSAKQSQKKVSDEFKLYEAISCYRSNDFTLAAKICKQINPKAIRGDKKPLYYNVLGKTLERLGDFHNAYSNFNKMNEVIKGSLEYKNLDKTKFLNFCRTRLEKLRCKQSLDGRIKEVDQAEWCPTFMVGFPRSGTTLLDSILRSHSQIQVVEEQEMISAAISRLSYPTDFIDKFPSFSEKRESLKRYRQEFLKYVDDIKPNVKYVDKLPLNILNIPEINFLFPNAKFILVIRHPLDVIFSNWVQLYHLNAAMSQMVDLKNIVEIYNLTMDIFHTAAAVYKLDFHVVKYENLVKNFKLESEALCQFMQLDWQSSVKDFHLTAKHRRQINTPSYAQVIQPLYDTSIERWRNYEDRLHPLAAPIMPWINKFNYTL